ncbi:GH92 family glycosyl hydrolase [Pedobacter sp. KR3-3]|uniref:GH92 family glycosyl hydrolase n=1 Tax=Pedobacter albus TaxID=3113905 RepID=A0ABU7I765_9SPHI|nr:GH92 family glycosyl hydrolase [Pedobacter sp. KR3-3]MEE1945301.1 GH92 family glycosyl hydrolase [Pedobacter sp. KR3-3]
MKLKSVKIAGLLLSVALLLRANSGFAQQPSNLQYVDPTIGSVGLILEPTRPAVHLPNSMVRVFPARADQLDDQIAYFPLTISSHRQNWLFGLMPYSGTINEQAWGQKFTSDNEQIRPDSYNGLLEDNGTKISFTPGAKAGFFEFAFATKEAHYLRFNILNNGEINLENKHALSGVEEFQGMKAYFYAETNVALGDISYQNGQGKKRALIKIEGQASKVAFKYGVSFISIEQAKENLNKEITGWDRAKLQSVATAAWNKVLSQVNVKGGTTAQKRVFYTSLYRSYERMVDINEYGKYYSAYDHQVHSSNRPFFVDNWLWDTYIALEPLQTILNPKMEGDKLNSYVQMYEQSGWMPSFALVFGDNPCMTGNHAAAWFLDSYQKGVRGFDLKKAYEGIKKNSLEATLLPWRNGKATSLDTFYNEKGYMPALKPGEKETVATVHGFEKRQSVSVTLENSFDDWCLAQLASKSGNEADRALFLKRAANYKNVFREDKGFVWPKDSEGNWIEPFDPKFSGGQGGREYFTENNAYTYNWDVKHDLAGLFQLMGGKAKAEEKLDDLFRASLGRSKYNLWYTFPDATGLVGQFVMGNEPSFHIPYLYNYLGAPWKTQKRIKMLLDTWYTDNLFGIPGDEDGGGMTAFVVFSMMGFFPVTPGVPVYSIGSPTFNEMSIKLDNGKTFTVLAKNNSATHKYIQSATLNGKVLNRSWFTHQELTNGGVLTLQMGSLPNKTWGSTNLPPSALNYNP